MCRVGFELEAMEFGKVGRPNLPAKQIVDALLLRFLPLAHRRIDTAQAQDGQYLRASDPAYEQVLDSLAMAAKYTPLALLEALSIWREKESPKGCNDASAFQKKLAVECIFCSACIRLGECCPHEGLPETSWKQLESFIFDWIINADRTVSQAEYPSLVDLRGLLLDLVAQLLGALSRIRFSSVTDAFFYELNIRRNDSSVARSETLSIIHGMRYLKLGVSTAGALGASTSFIGKANSLLRTPTKKKTEFHHALCNMLSNILAPLADGGKGQWPPTGVDGALALWYESVNRIRTGLLMWMDRQSKHYIVGYPLVTLLLCLGDPKIFHAQFELHLEHLYKHLREKNLRLMALDCLHRVVRFYLNSYSEHQQRNRVWDYLHSVTSQLLALLKKGSLAQDVQQDKLVEFCLTIAERNLDFAMNHMILELLRTENLSEAKVIGLRALLDVVSLPSHQQTGAGVGAHPHLVRVSSTGFSDGAHDITHYMPKVREALDHIMKTCHKTYGAACLTLSKTTLEPMTKEKAQGWLVFKWALKCIPNLLPDIWKKDKMTEILPSYGISIEPGVREEAVQVLFRTVQKQPQSRSAVMKGMANFILQLPDEFTLLIHTSLGRLVQLLQAWRACLTEESTYFNLKSFSSRDNVDLSYKSSFQRGGDTSQFHPTGMDAIGLIFLCSIDIPTRRTALELLRCVRELQNEIRRHSIKDRGKNRQQQDAEPTFVIDVFEEAGEDIVKRCYGDSGGWYDSRHELEAVPSDVTLLSILENHDKGRWAYCLSELVKHAAVLCPEAVDAARLEVVQRLANMMPSDSGGKGSQIQDFESKLEQWSNYTMFACSCPPENSDDGGTQEAKDLFNTIFPLLKSGSESQTFAATLALGHVHSELLETMLSSLLTFLEDISTEVENRSKWKSQKTRRDDIRIHVANVYRIAAENIWPGLLLKKPFLCNLFGKFIGETMQRSISAISTQPDSFQELQPLRFCLASVIRSLAPELVKGNSERFDPKTRKRLFDLLLGWCDDTVVPWTQDTVGDYRREIDRYKSAQNVRSKNSMEKINLDKEVDDQVEALQWVAMNAMAALLYGHCFDDSARKMSGRIISWINALFLDPASRVLGYSPADSRAPSQSKFSLASTHETFRNASGKERLRGSQFRVQLAKTALFNLLQTNLDLFPACIDQCYSSDSSIADGYFSVLAEVYMRQELPKCEIQRLLSLILYKVVDPSRQIRDDALQMLETLSAREWAEEGDGAGVGRYRAAVVGSLPDSYQQFQYQLSAKLAREHPELSELLCEEIMQRQLDAVDIIAQHQVLTCMAPWIENLQLWKHSGWCERLLKSMYYVTWRHGDQFPDEIEQLWGTIAKKVKNISPVLIFLIAKGIEDCDSNATGEISGAFATYFSVAKRISLYLARVSPQQTIDHLVCELAQRISEDHPEQLKRSLDFVFDVDNSNQVLEFSQGSAPQQASDPPPPMSPLLVRSSLEGGLRNVSGSLSWRNPTGRSVSGPLNAMPEMYTGRSGQLFTGPGGALPSLSGPLMGIRTSTGSMKSRHLSRDSGDYFVETPHSNEDARSTTSAITGEMQSGLQANSNHHWLSKADIALILLAEIAYENDEDFRGHLPLLFHVTFVSMDSSEDIVLEHCQQLLVNLLYSLAGRPLESYSVGDYGDGEYKQQVENLMKYVQSKKGSLMWENEEMSLTRIELPSATLLSALVQSVVYAIFFQGDLQERWGEEALKWAMECTSRHLACRSHQIYRALRPPVTSDTCVCLLRCLHRCFSNPSPPVLGFIMEILLTLQVIVDNMEPEKVILYPQLFWGCVAMLHTDFVHVYTQVLELFARVINRLSFHDQTVENVLLSNMPRDEDEKSQQDKDMNWVDSEQYETDKKAGKYEKAPMFEGVQPLVLKGLMSTVSHDSAIEVLSRITVNSCDCIFGNSETRLLMHIIGMLPWLCLQLQKEQNIAPVGSVSPLQQQYQKACSVAANICQWCDAKGLDELAAIFCSYSEGHITTMESLLDQVAPLLCIQWFPRHSALAFGHLLQLLEKKPVEYHRVILLLLKSLVQYTQMDPSQSPQVYAVITQFVESNLCQEALKVLEALLQSCSTLSGGANFGVPNTMPSIRSGSRRMDEDRSEKPAITIVSQSSFKSKSGPLYYSSGFGGPTPFSVASTTTQGSIDTVPSRETALQNTILALRRVVDTYGPTGKKRDYKRLVPFVASSVQMNNNAANIHPLLHIH